MAVYRGYVKVASDGITVSTVLGSVYPIGSVYAAAQNTLECPLQAVLPGSLWTKIYDPSGSDADVLVASAGPAFPDVWLWRRDA